MRGNPQPQFFDETAVKFILNLPKEQLTDQRIGFHFQKAYFYYLDTFGLKSLYNKNQRPKQIINFCNELLRIASYIQLTKLTGNQIAQLIQQNYALVPVNGIIILNMQETHALLVQSRDNNKLGFPKGKINEGQTAQQCANREVKQQIGLNLQVDSNYYVTFQVNTKHNSKSFSKWCRFYICKVEQSCIVPRKCHLEQKKQSTHRKIIHCINQIKSIGWYRISEQIPKLIDKEMLNTPSKLAFTQLMKKLYKNLNYRQKKMTNPLQQFKGFDKNLGQIFYK